MKGKEDPLSHQQFVLACPVEPVFRVPSLPLVERSYRANLPPEVEQNQVVWHLHACTRFDSIGTDIEIVTLK